MDTTSLKSPNIGERLKQPLEHRARRTTFEEDVIHCDHTIPSSGQHGTASQGPPGPTFSPVGKRGPEGDTQLFNVVGRFWGSPLGLASWRSLGEPTGLDHWGPEKDKGAGLIATGAYILEDRIPAGSSPPTRYQPAALPIWGAKLVAPSGHRSRLQSCLSWVPVHWAEPDTERNPHLCNFTIPPDCGTQPPVSPLWEAWPQTLGSLEGHCTAHWGHEPSRQPCPTVEQILWPPLTRERRQGPHLTAKHSL